MIPPSGAPVTDHAGAAGDPATRDALARALGSSYELRGLVGTGGFAEVYAAYDQRLKRQVAIKVLRPELRTDARVLERFRREAEAVARLRHPHIVPIYSVGEQDGLAYFVMPLLEGVALSTALEQEARWSFPEICRILREAASALAEAHRIGLIHRDVKPENIMLEGPERRVVLMDFGIAKAADERTSALTGTGMLVGSPHYMSPEQAVGDQVDQYSDQYSLALVGYRMLTGRLPFQADSLRALLYKQATEEPASTIDLRPDTPSALNDVILRGMAKERVQRFASMGEMAAALTRVAGEVAGDFRRQRVVQPLRERWTSGLANLYDRPWRYLTAMALGLALFGWAYPLGEAAGARRALGDRDSLVAVAAAALEDVGASAVPLSGHWFWSDHNFYAFLQSTAPDSVVKNAAWREAIWGWRETRLEPVGYHYASASVSSSGRLEYALNWLDDTVTRATLSDDSALALARAFLRRHGDGAIAPATPLGAVTNRPTRVDHTFTWTVPPDPRWPETDSVRTRLIVTVAGDGVSSFNRDDVVPPQHHGVSETVQELFGNLAAVLLVVLVFGGVAVTAKRYAFDNIQWGMSFRWALGFLVIYGLLAIAPAVPVSATLSFSAQSASSLSQYVVQRFSRPDFFGPLLMLLVLLAAAETLLYETRPETLGGLQDVSRLRLRIPEWLGALAPAYAAAALMVAVQALAGAAAHRWFGLPMAADTAMQRNATISSHPLLSVFSDLNVTVMAFALQAFLLALAVKRRRPWIAMIAGALIWASLSLMFNGPQGARLPLTLVDGFLIGSTTLLMLNYGLLAGALAILLFRTIPLVTDLFWAGGPFLPAAVVGVFVLVAPAILGLVIYLGRPKAQLSG